MKTFTLKFSFVLVFALAAFSASAQVVINEVDYDQPGTDTSEFVELYNNSANAVMLSDYSLIFYNGNASQLAPYDSITLPAVSLAPGAFFLVCASSTGHSMACDTFMYTSSGTSGRIQNGGTGNTAPDAVALRFNPTQNMVDAVSYEGTTPTPYSEGNGIPDTLSDNGITANVSISRYPDGSDTQDNATDFFLVCSTPGGPNCQPTATHDRTVLSKVVSVFPNPASSFVTVESKGSKSVVVSLRNILGKEVKHFSTQRSKLMLDINGVEEGIYLLFIRTDAGETTQRLIVRK